MDTEEGGKMKRGRTQRSRGCRLWRAGSCIGRVPTALSRGTFEVTALRIGRAQACTSLRQKRFAKK